MLAALRRDPNLLPEVKRSVKEKIGGEDGRLSTVVQAAEALQPIIEDAVRKRPSKLGNFGLKSAHLLADLAIQDEHSNDRLAHMANGSPIGIVFVDVAGFTSFTAEHGDESARSLLDELFRLIDAEVRKNRGECVKNLGDGFLLAFPSASQGVRGAVAVRDSIARHSWTVDGEPFDMKVHVGVHAGEPLIEHDDLLGHDVNLAARLLDHCKPGEVVVSEVAKEMAEKRLKSVEFGKRRLVKIRGLAGKVAVHPAKAVRADADRD